ncbi:uncharacterized protein GIQ15_02674 [Arthroderma uncinatum]|uniref:uncharacterized protein n=1 Tax=Arthroderma uncinatum TaxID=74035 RepID=UPI00144AB778|nr:uncharacterized protein GIQ15_02674 [Arthroderma uncinatum]KAF3483350.1 hypothetical protein GIQ15_02674 [Arthroderma uncinatum]
MEGHGCQQTSSDPPELQGPGSALVRLPAISSRPASFSALDGDLRVSLAPSLPAEDKEEYIAAVEPESPLTPVKPAETDGSSPSFDCPSPPRAHLHPLSAVPATQRPIQRKHREVSRERPAILTKLMEKFNVRDWSRPEAHPGVTTDKDEDASRIKPEDSAPSSSQHIPGEVKIYYPRLRDSESSFVPPNSAPLIRPAADNLPRPQPELPVTTRGNRPGLRKTSSAPALPRPEMNTEELSRLLNRDGPRQPNIEGIILGGPLFTPTQQVSHSTDGIPARVQRPAIPSIQGVFEGTVAPATPATMPTEPAATHTHVGDVINAHFERILMAQAANTEAILRSLRGLTNETRALREEVRANTNHLHQLNGRVAAVEARMGGLQPSGGLPLTGYQGPVIVPSRNYSGGQPLARHPPRRGSQPHGSGPVRDVRRGGQNGRRASSQHQHAVQPPRPGTTQNPLPPPAEPSRYIPPPQGSLVVSQTRRPGQQSIPRSRDASDSNGEWGGTSNWYRRAYANGRVN